MQCEVELSLLSMFANQVVGTIKPPMYFIKSANLDKSYHHMTLENFNKQSSEFDVLLSILFCAVLMQWLAIIKMSEVMHKSWFLVRSFSSLLLLIQDI